jgi:hypothetical protein
MSLFPTTMLLASEGSEEQSWWCVIKKETRRVRCTPYHISTFRNYTHSGQWFRAVLNKDYTPQRLEFVAIPGKPPLTLKGTPSVLP